MLDFAATVFAMAPAGQGGDPSAMFGQFVPLILIFGVFWFLVIRPQQKKAKQHREMVAELKKGDEVYTDSGIRGTIQKVAEDYVTLEIAPKVPIKLMRGRVSEVIKEGKGEASEKKSKDKDKDEE